MSTLDLLSPEARLILLCAGDADDAALHRLLECPIDWPTALRLADREGAAPLLWERLSRMGASSMPPEAAARLRTQARVTQFKMLYMEQRVAESVAALDAAGVPGVLLKGAALAVAAYGSFVHRPMVDFDVLVHPASVDRALTALLAAGWVWRADKRRDADYSHLHHLPALLDARGVEISLELHTALLPDGQPFVLEAENVVDSARSARIGRVPDPYHMLLHASIHFVWGHMLRKGVFRVFRDTAVILKTYQLDAARLKTVATAARATTACYWTLRLAASLGGIKVPQNLLDALRPPGPEAVLLAMERHLGLILLPVAGSGCPSVRLRQLMWTAAIRPGRSGHGRSRPWKVLALTPQNRALRAADAARQGVAESSRSPSAWMRYGRAVLVPVAAPERAAWKQPVWQRRSIL